MQNKQKGFTLIELLVVIAIIGILATIVLTSLGSARSKANDAKYEGQLSSMRSAAENYYSGNSNSYGISTSTTGTGVCNTVSTDPTGLYNLTLASNYGGTEPNCNSNGTAWAAWHLLASDTTKGFCVDSTGKAELVPSTTATTITACP